MTFHPAGVAPVLRRDRIQSIPPLQTAPAPRHPTTTSRSKSDWIQRHKRAPATDARTGTAAFVDMARPTARARPAIPHPPEDPCQRLGIDRPRSSSALRRIVFPQGARHALQSWWPSTVYQLTSRRAFSPTHGTTTRTRPSNPPFLQLVPPSRLRPFLVTHITPLCGCCHPPSTISRKPGEK